MIVQELDLIGVLSFATGGAFLLFMWYAACVSHREGERRARMMALLFSFVLSTPYFLVGSLSFEHRTSAAVLLLLLTVVLLGAVFLPSPPHAQSAEIPKRKFDERDTMFSRNELREGTREFADYYSAHPDLRQADDRFRSEPGLLSVGARHYDTLQFAAARAGFTAVEAFHRTLDQPPADNRTSIHPDHIMSFLRHWIETMGGLSVGVTRLRDYHLYSTLGRGERYGKVTNTGDIHDYAIAITVEMDRYMVRRAPRGPIVMESARQYLRSGLIAVQVADIIRNLGYEARAHIDGNYHVVCPLVARDAGLGEIGRMGLLMTPEVGPRVRISVVTTSLPLRPDPPRFDSSIIEFCKRCRKCAAVCPGRAIPFDDRTEIDGVKRWKINAEECFTFWCTSGTDCGRCVSVCPYAHPKNHFHDLIRWSVRRSRFFREVALLMDNIFYGEKPVPLPVPEWMRSGPRFEQGRRFVREKREV